MIIDEGTARVNYYRIGVENIISQSRGVVITCTLVLVLRHGF